MINIKKVLEYIVNMTQNSLKSESIKQQLNITKDANLMQYLAE